MTLFVHDGFAFDLDRVYVDVVGVEWRWNGDRNRQGEPLMVGGACTTPVPLPDVYRDHGPLIPLTATVPAELKKAVLAADSPAAVDAAAGHLVTDCDEWWAQARPAPAPAPVVTPPPDEVRRGFFARLAKGVAR
ncbi:phiSA1p31-related protein [Streptomyces sp. NPDC059015]|uniref:phiSA1p31-related protein n=1 Tax=unclassified Streptomyces TaxID=2593676 RepID=UPI0036B2E30C